jgi:hypothetical protein
VNPFELPKATPNSLIKPSSSPTDTPMTNCIITLLHHLQQLIQRVSHGATNHMLLKEATFISYKLVSNLQVRMGNNSFLPALGRGTAAISLNGQRVLIRNTLQVPGLVMPLYSLQAHLTQCGCAFYGAYAAGMLVCSQPLCSQWPRLLTVTSHTNLLVAARRWISSIMSNPSAHPPFIHWSWPLLHRRCAKLPMSLDRL